jgi:hypothetical protein
VNSRAPTLDDAPEIARFIASVSDGDPPDEDEVRGWLKSPSHDVEGNFRMWFESDELVVYSDLGVFGDAAWLDLRVRADQRGGPVEDEVLAWNIGRAAELEEASVLRHIVDFGDERGAEAAARAGLVPIRHSFRMRIELTE